MDLNGEIIRLIARYKDIPPEDVAPDRTFDDLGIDSLDAMDILYEIEDHFSVQISQEDLNLQELRRVGDIAVLVERVRNSQPGEADLG